MGISSFVAVGFGVANLANVRRDLVLRFAGNFTITTANQTFYFNDGTNRSANIPVGSYTAATLATAIAAAAKNHQRHQRHAELPQLLPQHEQP